MNGKKISQIRQVVQNIRLVRTIEEYQVRVIEKGEDILKAMPDDKSRLASTIASDKTYKRLYTTVRPLNHVDQLKKFYKKHGDDAVPKYIVWLSSHHAKMLLKYPQIFKPTTDDNSGNSGEQQ